MAQELLYFTLILVLTTALVLVLRLFRQPPLIGYLLAGLLVGPTLLGWSTYAHFLDLFGDLGIAFLLFIVGINLDFRALRRVGVVALGIGGLQMLLTLLAGAAVSYAFGFGLIQSAYIGLGVAFSSTIIVIKLLTDNGDIDALHGKMGVAILLVQDLVAVLALTFIGAGGTTSGHVGDAVAQTLVAGVAVALLTWGIYVYILPRLLHAAGKSQETLFLFSVAWAFAFATLFSVAGLSLEVGALVAGLMLASTTYSYEIASRIKPLRDFFIILFFIALGAQMRLDALGSIIIPAAALTLLVLVGKPLIIMGLLGQFGFSRRTSFLSGAVLAQISEFSLIIAALGASQGHVGPRATALLTLVGLTTIAGSTWIVQHQKGLYRRIGQRLPYWRRGVHRHEHRHGHHTKPHSAILFGYDRIGYAIGEHFQKYGTDYLVVDFDPEVVLRLREGGVHAIFGDADDVELYEELRFDKAKLVVSTIPEKEPNSLILSQARKANPDATVILTAIQPDEALELYEEGADYVVVPHIVGGDHAAFMLDMLFTDLSGFLDKKNGHVEQLKSRKR